MTRTTLPPGFRFYPTDVELMKFYLKRKVMGKRIRFEVIAEIDIYKFAPWDLPDKSCLKSKDLEWYFFCPRERKYTNGARMNRATEYGYWKTTGKDRPILYNEQTVGMIKTLIFHTGRAPKGDRTDWVMHEYRLEDKDLADTGIVQDAFVICKIFQKSGPGPRNGAQYGAPFNEEEWSDDEEVAGIESFPLAGLYAPAPVLQNNQDSSAVTGTFIPGTICIGSSSESTPPKTVESPDNMLQPVQEATPSRTVQSPDNMLRLVQDDVSMPESPLLPDDDVRSLLDCFIDDIILVPNENDINEVFLQNLDSVNRDESMQTASSDVNNIYNDLGELGKWPELCEDQLYVANSSKTVFATNQMLGCEDGLYLELNDLQLPLGGSSNTRGSERTPIDAIPSHYNFYNTSEQPYHPVNYCDVQRTSAISQSSVLHEESYEFENRLDVFQEPIQDNGVKEYNQGFQEYEATMNNAEVSVLDQPQVGSGDVSQVQTRGEQQRSYYSSFQHLLESIPPRSAFASELQTSISCGSIHVKAECTEDTLSIKLGEFPYVYGHSFSQPRKLSRKKATSDSGVMFVLLLVMKALICIFIAAVAARCAWNLSSHD